MEFFTAIDEGQMQFIERVIDESDYYVLLLGARYGSLDSEGISYTEREYDYAVKQGKKVIALIHKNPDKIEFGKTDKDDELYRKFMAFRQKVIDAKRLVAFWEDTTELVVNFQSSLIQTIQIYPAIGWMRGDSLASTDMLQKIASLELENQRLKEQIKNIGGIQVVTDIKMEACSVTAPTIFSEKEIECNALNIILENNQLDYSHPLFDPHKPDLYTHAEIYDFYINHAVPWFCKMARNCRFDLRITNPNSFVVKNMDSEQHFIDLEGNDFSHSVEDDRIESSPQNPELENISIMTRQYPPTRNLNPHQSTLYTHARNFMIDHEFSMIYHRVIFAENILDPIHKEIKVNFKIKNVKIHLEDLILLIQKLEQNKKFNDAGVYEYVTSVLEKEDFDKCNAK